MQKRRVSQSELLHRANSVKTFDNQIYELKGTLAVDKSNGDIQKVADVYYRVRTAKDKSKDVIAKRKHTEGELVSFRKKN